MPHSGRRRHCNICTCAGLGGALAPHPASGRQGTEPAENHRPLDAGPGVGLPPAPHLCTVSYHGLTGGGQTNELLADDMVDHAVGLTGGMALVTDAALPLSKQNKTISKVYEVGVERFVNTSTTQAHKSRSHYN